MNIKIQSPRTATVLEDVESLVLTNETAFRMSSCLHEYIADIQVAGVIFDESVFKNITFQNVKIRSFECSDMIFENCQFINCEFIGSFVQRTKFSRCRLIGVNFSESSMVHVHFENCLLEMIAFYYTKMHWIHFDHDVIRNSDFYEDDSKHWLFNDSELSSVEFNKTPLAGVDFRTCQLEKLRVTFEALKDCIVTPTQALGMAALLGLSIKENWE